MNTNVNALNAGPAFYDDSGFNYREYWTGREYEHLAEVIALRRLLAGQRKRGVTVVLSDRYYYDTQVNNAFLARSKAP